MSLGFVDMGSKTGLNICENPNSPLLIFLSASTSACRSLWLSTGPEGNERKKKIRTSKNIFLKRFPAVLSSLPCCFWRSHSSCWAQKWPPWRQRTERPFSRSAAAWSSWRCLAPKTPSGPSLGANVWNFSLHLLIFNLTDVKIWKDCEKRLFLETSNYRQLPTSL